MSPDLPRVLVTGAGGPSGVAILQAMEPAPVTLYAADIDPYGAGLYLVASARRAILPRGEDPRFADALLEICVREQVDVVVPTVDTELLPLAAARERFAEAGVRLVLASDATLSVCLDKWLLAERCRGSRARAARRPSSTTCCDAVRVGAAGDRQAALGQRLARHPPARAPRAARGARARRHAARPGAPPRPGVLARRARARRRPRRGGRAARAAEGRLRHRRHRPHAARRAARRVRARDRAADRPDDRRQRPGQGGRDRRARAARGQPALPGHDAADDRQRRRHAAARDRRGARRRRSPTARCRSTTSRWCASSRSASSPSTRSPTCSATRRCSAHEPPPGHARPLDVLRRQGHDRGERRRGGGARADAADVRRPRARRHRLGAGVRRRGARATRRRPTSSCSAASRRSCWTRAARSTCPDRSRAST